MKCISLIQPWATLWALGIKLCETRSWPTSYRGELHIHASKTYDEAGEILWEHPRIEESLRRMGKYGIPFANLPRGSIIGRVNIVDCVLMTNSILESSPTSMKLVGGNNEDGLVCLSDLERLCGQWSKGRFAWVGANHTLLDAPIEAKGSLGLWEYDPEAQKAAEEERQKLQALVSKVKAAGRRARRRTRITQILPPFDMAPYTEIDPPETPEPAKPPVFIQLNPKRVFEL
jgi:hypothetical protein